MKEEIQLGTSHRPPQSSAVSVKTMNIVFFAHPDFLGHVSMPRFAGMLVQGMTKRGHRATVWSPKRRFFNLPFPQILKKWLGYIDQYIVFPFEVRSRLKSCPDHTLFVFTDNALGPWVPLVASRPHVMHCHDFMAQESALGLIPENPTSWTGRLYQKLIFRGYCKSKNFISGSQNTKNILHRFLPAKPTRSELVLNGLNQSFEPIDPAQARALVGLETGLDLKSGYLLHVGGNQWYKNRVGLIEMYDAWRSSSTLNLPLLLIGLPPSPDVLNAYKKSPYKENIYFFTNARDNIVHIAYAGATVFLFPSKAEGFGWPVAEAMASGCPVITTNEAPMTEVAGDAAFFVPRRPYEASKTAAWAHEAGKVLGRVVELSPAERQEVIEAGLKNAKRFDTEKAINKIEMIYHDILLSRR
jgi:glycosyltransferase involved in cell wall biosynthesis